MSALNLRFNDVSFSYSSSIKPVLSSLNIHFSKGWTGIVGANGIGKSTVAKLVSGILKPTTGSVIFPDNFITYYCSQYTENLPSESYDFLFSYDSDAGKISSLLEIKQEWFYRWDSLSHGERKRIQIAIAVWKNPDVLVLDEPVNHIDSYTKKILLKALKLYNGIGIIISHERYFLDELCDFCLFMHQGSAVLRKGNYTKAYMEQVIEETASRKELTNAFKEYKNIKKRADSLKRKEKEKNKNLSKRNVSKKDHDLKSKIDAARLTGKDKTGSRKAKLFEQRSEKAREKFSSLYKKERKIEGITFHGEKSKRDYLFKIYEQKINLGPEKFLCIPALEIFPEDRIAITGKNGAGKSTLLKKILSFLNLDSKEILYIPQEIDSLLWKEVQHYIGTINNECLGLLLDTVYRLGSEPEDLIYSNDPSPGEKRKIMLASGLLKKPCLIIMDEPTNYMDIPSIQCLETALKEYSGALLIVSHDSDFINNTTNIIWELEINGNNSELKK